MSEKRTSPMRKRIFSLVLALVMLLSTVPVTALASEEDVLDGITVIADQVDSAVSEEPVATEEFYISSIGYGSAYMDAVAQDYGVCFNVDPADTVEITGAEMYIDVYDADSQLVYSGWVSADRVIVSDGWDYEAIFALTDEMLGQAAYGAMNIMALKVIDSENRYAMAETDGYSEHMYQVNLEDTYCEKLYVTDMTVDTDVVTLTQEVREAQASVTARVVAAEGYTITGEEELRVMWSCDTDGYGGSQTLQQDENGQWYFTSTAYIGYDWVAGDYQVEVYEVGTDRLLKNLGEPAGLQVIRDLPDNEAPVLTEISFIRNGEEIKADFENSFSLPYGSEDKLQVRLYVDDASPLIWAYVKLKNDSIGVETGLSMSYDEEQMVWQADFELGTSTLEPGEWYVSYVHLRDKYYNKVELYARNAYEVFQPARFFVADENGETITPAYDYYGNIRYWNGSYMEYIDFDSESGPYATTDELGLQLPELEIADLTFQGWKCEHEGIEVMLNAGDRLPGRGGWYTLTAVYDKVVVNVRFDYTNVYGGWESGEMYLAVPVGTTYAQIPDIFAEAMADVEHNADMGFTGWKMESSWMQDMNAEVDYGDSLYFSAQYSRQYMEVCYSYLNEGGNVQEWYVQDYFNSEDTYADIAVWAAENVPEGIIHSDRYGYTGQWLAQYPDLVVGESEGFCRVYAVYETVPLNIGYSYFDEDLNRLESSVTVELSGESTVQEAMDCFVANYADEVSHPSFLTLDHWEMDGHVELTDTINIVDWVHFAPIYKQPIVTLDYTYATTTQYGDEEVTEQTTLVLDEGATVADLRAAIAEIDAGLDHVDALGSYEWQFYEDLQDDTVLAGTLYIAAYANYENPYVRMEYQYYDADFRRQGGTAVFARTEGMTVQDAFNSFGEQFGDLPHAEEMEFNGWEWEGGSLDNEAYGWIGRAVATYRNIVVNVEYEDYRYFEDGRLMRDIFSRPVAVPQNSTVADVKAAFEEKCGSGNAADVLGPCTWTWFEYPMDDETVYSGMWMNVECSYEKFPVHVTYRYWDADGEYRIEKASLGVAEGATHADVIDLFNTRIASNVEHSTDYGEALGWAVETYWSSDKEPTWREAGYTFDAQYEEETPKPTRVYLAFYTNYNQWNRYHQVIYEVDGKTTYGELVEAMAEEVYQYLGHYSELTFQGWTAPEGISMDDPVELFQGDLLFVADYDKIPAVAEFTYVNSNYSTRYEECTVFLPEDATYQDLYDAVALPDDGAHCPELGFVGWDVDITTGAAMTDPICKVDYDSLYCDMTISAQYASKAIDVQLAMLNEQGEVITDGFRACFDADMSLQEYLMTLEWPDCGHELIGWRTTFVDGGDYTGWREMAAVYADMAPMRLEVQYADENYNNRGFQEYIYLSGTYDTLTEEEYLAAAEDALQSKLDQFVPDGLNVRDTVVDGMDLGTAGSVAYVSYSVEYDKALLHMHMPHEITVSVAVDYGAEYDLPTTFNGRPIVWEGFDQDNLTVCVDQPHFGVLAYYADEQDDSCGESAYWELMGDAGDLIIHGEGAVTSAPWNTETLKPYIKHVLVQPGITALPADAFTGCGNIEFIQFSGETAPELAEGCFEGLNIVVIHMCHESWTDELKAACGGTITWAVEHFYNDEGLCERCGEQIPVELGWYVDEQGKLNIFNDAIPDFAAPEEAPWADEAANITEIVVGGNVPYIGENAFAICTNADQILFAGEAPEFHENAFAGFTGTVRYMPGSTTWDEVVGQQFGGSVTWEAYVGPEAPANVSVELNEAGQPVVTWDPVEGVEIYVVYRQLPGGEYEIVFHTEGTSFTHKTAALAGTTYNYKVCSYDSVYDIFGPLSEAVSVATPAAAALSDPDGLLSGIADNLYWWSHWQGFFAENEAPDANLVHGFLDWVCNDQFSLYEMQEGEFSRAIWAAAFEEMAFAYFVESEELLSDLHSSDFYDGDGYYYYWGGSGDIMPEYYYRGYKDLGDNLYEVYGYEVQWYDGFDDEGMPITYVPGEDEVEGVHYVMCTRTYEDENGETVTETYSAKIVGVITTKIHYVNGYPKILANTRADYAAPASGTCGENATWTLVDGVLTISGTGAMYDYADYASEGRAPWCTSELRETVTKIIVEDGITYIGDYAFRSCVNATSAVMADSVTSTGECAFMACYALGSVVLSENLKTIGYGSFASNTSLTEITLPEGLTVIGEYSFRNCPLKAIVIPASVTEIGPEAFMDGTALTEIKFCGSAPVIGDYAFGGLPGIIATVYYPCGDESWNAETMTNYGGKLTWTMYHTGNCDECGTALVITKQPENVSVHKGETASVTVVAEGEDLTYQWYFKNKQDTGFGVSSIKTATYSATMDNLRDGRQIYCVITDKSGNSVQTDTVTLTMLKPEITVQPQSVTGGLNETVTVSFTAEGEGLTYEWYYKNAGASDFVKTTTFTGPEYTTQMTEARAGRQIYCVVTDKYGASTTTDTVTLNLRYIDAEILVLYMNAEDEYTYVPTYVSVPEGATYQALYDLAQFPTDHTVNLGELVEWKPGKTLTDVIAVDPEGEMPTGMQITAVYEYIYLDFCIFYLDANGEVGFDPGATRIPTGSTPSEFFDSLLNDSGYEINHWGMSGWGAVYDMSVTAYACYEGMVPVRTTVEYQNAEGETDYASEVIYIENFDNKSEEQIKAEIYAYLLDCEGLCPEGTDITGYTMDEYNFAHGVDEESPFGPNCFIFASVKLLYSNHVHVLTKVDAKDAACKESGNIAYYICACGKWFSDEAAENEITDKTGVIIPATGHTETVLPGRDATCTEPGLTEGKVCDACGEITVKQEIIPALGHSEDILPGKDATCTEPGLTEGLYCTTCGEILVEQNTIPATGHTEHIEPGKDATCTDPGLTDHVTCEVCGITLAEPSEIPALGHEETVLDAVDPTCTETGRTEGVSCSRCGEILSGYEVVDALGHKEIDLSGKAPTCTETGLTAGKKCTVCGEITVQQTVIPALGHSNVTDGVCGVCGETVVSITKQPVDVSVGKGVAAEITVAAEGEDLSYSWYIKNKGDKAFSASSIKTATYSAQMNAQRDGRQVYCVVTDKYGNSVQTNTVTMTMLKPEITVQPESVKVELNKTFTVSFTAQGEGLTYEWYYKDAGADQFTKTSTFTSNSYTTQMTEARAGRQIYCVVTDKYGSSVTTDTVTLSLDSKVIITQQPVDVTVAKGQTAKVSFTATGLGLTYEWYYKNKGASSFTKTATFTGPEYTAQMNETRDGRQIYCVVTDKYGVKAQTDTVTLNMIPLPEITQQPESVKAKLGESLTVSFTAEGEDLTYEWYYKDAGAAEFLKTSTFTGPEYTTQMTEARADRQIYCVVTDKYGFSAQTDTVTLQLDSEVLITQQPTDVTVAKGQTAEVSFTATGLGLTYEWYFKNAGETKFTKTTTFTGPEYTTTMNEARAGRQIYCVVTDKFGNSAQTETVTLGMYPLPEIIQQPVAEKVKLGETVTVSFTAEGEDLTYEWYFKNAGQSSFTKTTTFTGPEYTTQMTEARADRQIYCVVTDKYGVSVKTNTVTLTPDSEVIITQQPVDVTVAKGQTAEVSFTATGLGLTYEWYFKNAGQSSFTKTTTFTGPEYTAQMNETRDGRQIYCVVTDKYGVKAQTDTVTLNMIPLPEITQQPESVKAKNGEEVVVSFTAEGEGLTYEWYYKNKGASSFTKTATFAGPEYTTTMNATRDGRQIYCVVTDKYGFSIQTNTVTLEMEKELAITKQPQSVTAASGKTVTVSFTAQGEGLTYEWYYKNFGDDAFTKTATFTGPEYTTTMNAARSGRQIYCVVTDKYGNSVQTDIVALNMEGSSVVYVAASGNGTKYHSDKTCSNMEDVLSTTVEIAEQNGYTACGKSCCFG